MYNQKTFQSILTKIGINFSYRIWLTTPEIHNFILIDKWGVEISEAPKQIFLNEEIYLETNNNDKTNLYLKYPDNYQMVVCFSQSISIEQENLQILYHLLYPCYAQHALKASKFKIDKIIDSSKQTTSTLDMEELLSNILTNTMEVIPNADIGILWVYYPEIERLVYRSSFGNLLKGVREMQFTVGEGIVGNTFKSGKPILYNQLTKPMINGIGRISAENSQYWDDSYDFLNEVKSMITAPILVGDRVQCVMLLAQIKKKSMLTEQDIQLLQGFTSQIGIAMRNTQLYMDLKKKNELLVKRDDIHSTLTNLSYQNRGISKVILELTRIIGRPIFFVDLIENESFPESKELLDYHSYKKLYNFLSSMDVNESYTINNSGQRSHYLYPIRTGNVILGGLILRAENPLDQLNVIALEQAHSILTLELVKKQNLVEYYYKKKRDLFNEILLTKDPLQLQQKVRELGIKEHSQLVAVIFQFPNFIDPQMLESRIHRLITQIKNDLHPLIQTVFGNNNEVTLLVCLPNSAQYESFIEKLDKLIKEWSSTKGIDLSVGIGTSYDGVQFIEKSYNEAMKALVYLSSRQQAGYIQYSKIGLNRLFINQTTEEINLFMDEVFGPLSLAQGVNRTLEKTLLTYFECNRSAVQTAKKMHIHINTLYQRLKKIEEILQISFENPENVLRIQLACYLKESLREVES